MIKRITIGDVRITFTIARIVKAGGFNSLLTDGNHILMWDFDDVKVEAVEYALWLVQQQYKLPKIYLLETRKDNSYIAYCFKKVSWFKAIKIINDTLGVDRNFFKYGVYRDKFTLRVTDKGYGKPHFVKALESKVPEDASMWEFKSWSNYETLKPK